MNDKVKAAERTLAAACESRDAAYKALDEAPEDTPEDDVKALEQAFDTAQAEVERCTNAKKDLERRVAAREATPTILVEEETETRHATPVGGLKQEPTYRKGDPNVSFFRDVINAGAYNDTQAAERLNKHMAEMRDISTTATAGGGFVPPLYMGELWADVPRPGREFADILPKLDLPSNGMSITLPRITTGAAVAATTSENSSVNEVDIVEALVTTPVTTIAGQQDVSQQLFDRSDPAIDAVIFQDLRTSYDMKLDTGLLSGTGSSGQNLGIRAVTSVNTETYTDASPTGAELLPKIYEASSKVFSTRYAPADTIVMSPRRAAWMASQLSSTFPLFQQGNLVQAAGTQDNAFLTSFAGLRVIIDANVGLTYGASTNEDEIYVLRTADLYLMEGPLHTRVLTEVLSGTLTVRLQLYAYTAFISARFPSAITVISGTGLAAPSF